MYCPYGREECEEGDYFRRALRSLSADHDMIRDIRGKGIMIGVEFVKDRETKTPALGQAKKGLLCVTRGRYQQVLEVTPPLNVTPEQIDAAIEILDTTLKEKTH